MSSHPQSFFIHSNETLKKSHQNVLGQRQLCEQNQPSRTSACSHGAGHAHDFFHISEKNRSRGVEKIAAGMWRKSRQGCGKYRSRGVEKIAAVMWKKSPTQPDSVQLGKKISTYKYPVDTHP
ncbi:hypothetical protein RRG08_011152 [Elysia crispata]|uniref:Uncharacterized protein n=1 Tax=Elysia crispata TaxID=231223 RepID=A0AAE1DRM4_9GAST|nr:hypothetical protein RRG08_011152 [Elysia crispata]